MIRKVGGKWVLFTADGSRRLGTHPTRAAALAQERAVEASKAKAKGGKATMDDISPPEKPGVTVTMNPISPAKQRVEFERNRAEERRRRARSGNARRAR